MGPPLRKYGVAATIDGIPLIVAGETDYKANPTLASGDAKVSKNGGALANLATLPAVTPASSRLVRISLSVAEMTAARIVILFVDQSSPKQWEDQIVIVETYGHPSAAHAFDLDTAQQTVDAVKISGSTTAADDVKANIGNLDAAVTTRSSHNAAAIWAVGSRTLTSFGTLVADIATAVWAAGARTLTGGVNVIQWLGVAVTAGVGDRPAVDAEGISGSTATADDVEAKIGNLDAAVSTRGTLAKQTDLLQGQSYQNGLIAALEDLSAAEVNAEVDTALNTAIPGSPTEHSINERVKAIDEKLPGGTLSDFDESADGVNVTAVGGEAVSGPDDLKGTGVSVTLGAVVATPLPGNRNSSPMPFEMFRKEAKTFAITVQDADRKPVDLSEKTLRFVVIDSAEPAVGQFKIDEGASLMVSGDNNEVASVTISTTQSAVAHDDWHWLLWDTVADEVLAHGSFKIVPAVEDVT